MEGLETINKRLLDYFSKDIASNQPIWRIVWSEDQYEKQLTKYTPEGLELLYPEMREVPKYKQWIHNKYILERLVIVPPINETELTTKTNYEPVWVFEDKHGNPLPPKWEVCKYVIDCVLAAQGKSNLAHYNRDDESVEKKEERVNRLMEELFGNETSTTDALAYREGVAGFHPKVH